MKRMKEIHRLFFKAMDITAMNTGVHVVFFWNLLYDAENPKLVICDKLEGWNQEEVGGWFRKEGSYVYLWLIQVDVWQKPSQYCKVIILWLKIKIRTS